MNTQLAQLARKFPKSLVKKAPQGKFGDYVAHSTVTEKLLSVLGPFSFEVRDVIRGHVDEMKTAKRTYPARENGVVGVLATLSVTVDGKEVKITEVGTEDTPAMHHDGDNLKNATSDAMKRCAMRLGVALHLWSGDDYILDQSLKAKEEQA